MEWFELNEQLLPEAFQDRECADLLTLRSSADPVPGICKGLAARIRAAVLANGRCQLQGGGNDIPQALRADAVAILRVKILVRFNMTVSEDRRNEARRAEERLDAIARGEMPFADGTPQARPAYYGRKRHRRQPMNGGIM